MLKKTEYAGWRMKNGNQGLGDACGEWFRVRSPWLETVYTATVKLDKKDV